jgi:putative DNA primase/helicase
LTLSYERRGAGRVLTADETAERRKRVRAFWHRCDYATGTPAAAYLARRGLSWLTGHENIRYRPDAPHPAGGTLPAMVALVYDGVGNIAAVHRTFLDLAGMKAAVDPPKASIGPIAGGAIRLHPAGPELLVAEGLETAASAGLLLGLPAWAAIACGNLGASMVLPPTVRAVVVAADSDGPGRRAAHRAARRWQAEGRAVRIATPDQPGQDFNDVLLARLHGAAEAAHA